MVCVEGGEQFGRRKSKDELKASINTVCSACTYISVLWRSHHNYPLPTGEEELQLKKKRDASYARCSELRNKLKSSREAQQQIAAFTSKTNSAPNATA